MTYISSLLGMLAFRTGSLRAQAERRAPVLGILFFCVGFLAYVLVRNSVYAVLPELIVRRSSLIGSFLDFQLIQSLLFLLIIYVPAIIVISNAISGDGFGLSVSRQEYQSHLSVLLPLWGMLYLICAPLQWLVPHFLIIGLVEISIGMLIRSLLLLGYTFWAIRQLNYLSFVQALGVFFLTWFTAPLYFVLSSFLFALPLFIMIPLVYFGYQWIRGYQTAHAGERAYQQHLNTLTQNPQDADAQYQLGLIYLKRRSLDAARRYFESAIKIDLEDADYHYYLGRTHELKGEWALALEQFEETYRIAPEYGLGDIFREVGKGYLHTGNPDKAIEFLKFFLTKRESDPEGRYWLAVAYKNSGDAGQMNSQLQTIIEHARSNPRFFRKGNREWIYRARSMIRGERNHL
jgi:tetratricopeptide (TPR) repeat protein